MEIVAAIVVIVVAAKEPVALIVAGRHHRIVAPWRGVVLEGEDGPAMVGVHLVADSRIKPGPGGAAMLHAEIFVQLTGDEGPEVDHLSAMGIDDLDGLTLGKPGCLATPGGYHLQLCHGLAVL